MAQLNCLVTQITLKTSIKSVVCNTLLVKVMNSRVLEAISKINPVLLWRAVQRRLPAIVGIMVTAGMISYFAMSLLTPEFSSVSRVALSKTDAGKTSLHNEISKQLQSFYQPDFLQNVIKTLNLQTHPEFMSEASDNKTLEQKITSRLQVRKEKNLNVLSVRFISTDPNLAADAANAFSNAYLEQLADRQTKLKGRLVSRAVVPLSPDFPKRGPFALFIMSLMGLVLLGYIFVKEYIISSTMNEEQALDAKHHDLDVSQKDQPKQAPIIKKHKAGPVFRGIYPWQPEVSVDEVFEQLKSLKNERTPFRILVSTENEGVSINEDTLTIARAFSEKKHPTLLIDISDDELGLSTHLGLEKLQGLSDVVNNPSILGSIIHTDTESSVHIVAKGRLSFSSLSDRNKSNLVKIFHAWSAVYEVVIVCCSYQQSLKLYDMLDSEFEAAVFVQNENTVREKAVSKIIADKDKNTDIIYFRQMNQKSEEDNVIAISSGLAS